MGVAPGKSVAEEHLTALSSTTAVVSDASSQVAAYLRLSDLLATMVAVVQTWPGDPQPSGRAPRKKVRLSGG